MTGILKLVKAKSLTNAHNCLGKQTMGTNPNLKLVYFKSNIRVPIPETSDPQIIVRKSDSGSNVHTKYKI